MKVLILSLLLTGCGCNVSKGDIVEHIETGNIGEIMSIDSSFSGTDECQVAVRFNNGKTHYWVKGWEFKLINTL